MRLRRYLPLCLALLAAWGCGPSPERLACLDDCAAGKDDCILRAQGAQEIQACDAISQQCNFSCPE